MRRCAFTPVLRRECTLRWPRAECAGAHSAPVASRSARLRISRGHLGRCRGLQCPGRHQALPTCIPRHPLSAPRHTCTWGGGRNECAGAHSLPSSGFAHPTLRGCCNPRLLPGHPCGAGLPLWGLLALRLHGQQRAHGPQRNGHTRSELPGWVGLAVLLGGLRVWGPAAVGAIALPNGCDAACLGHGVSPGRAGLVFRPCPPLAPPARGRACTGPSGKAVSRRRQGVVRNAHLRIPDTACRSVVMCRHSGVLPPPALGACPLGLCGQGVRGRVRCGAGRPLGSHVGRVALRGSGQNAQVRIQAGLSEASS